MTVPRPYMGPLEVACLRHVAAGLTFAKAAEQLGYKSQESVRFHLKEARRRLGARNVAHLVALGVLHGYVTAAHLRATAKEHTP